MSKIAALYLRISNEDDCETKRESNSISSQREIIKTYIRNREEFFDYEVEEFCDDGYSGTNFKRPQMQQLLERIKKGQISCVFVKDFSRFGRNYIEVGTYLEQVFPFLGVRFIAVNDFFDSKVSLYSGEFMGVAFQSLICDLYSKDLSKKITSVRKTKAEQGKFITPYAPYGYQKSREQHLVVDPEAAVVIQRIFQMAKEGMAKTHIAKMLNGEGIKTPLTLRKQRGETFQGKDINENYLWKASVISAILKDQRYVGDAIYGKVRPTSVGSKKGQLVPMKQWIVVENQHEEIVSRELFHTVNEMFTKRKHYKRGEQMPLSGMVRCASCNHIISRHKRESVKRGQIVTYRCVSRLVSEEAYCYKKGIEEVEIEQAILWLLKKISMVFMSLEVQEFIEQFLQEQENKRVLYDKKLEQEMKKQHCKQISNYGLYKEGKISKMEFLALQSKMNQERNQLMLARQAYQKEAKSYNIFDCLTRQIVESFVEQVWILEDGTVQIQWKCKDLFPVFYP